MQCWVLKNNIGEAIRVFRLSTDKVYVVYRKNRNRLDLCSSPDFFDKDSVILLDEFSAREVKERPVPVINAKLELCNSVENIRETLLSPPSIEDDVFNKSIALTAFLCLFLYFGVFSLSKFWVSPEVAVTAPEPNVVKIIKPEKLIKPQKIVVGSQTNFLTETKKIISKPKRSLKKMGALSVLGSLSKKQSNQMGGLDLGANKVSAGPGLRAVASNSGSGGVQTQLYSAGMITSALGAGGNIRGGGGYGTKGSSAGGGSAGYGKLSLVGSGGDSDLSQTSFLNDKGGTFDFSIIDREIIKHRDQIRACYIKALQTQPDLQGLFQFYFQVNSKGYVVFSKLSPSSPVQSSLVSSCIFEIINKIRFPIRLQSTTQLNYAFQLTDL